MKKLLTIAALGFLFCGYQPTPKDTIFKFIRAVYDSDSTRIVELLDVDAYVRRQMAPMPPATSPEDSVEVYRQYRRNVVQSFLGDGERRAYWLKSQILVNREYIEDDTAEVEVSFIDRVTGVLRYTKIHLERQPDDTWKIVYFER